MQKNRRRRKLILPKLQINLILRFLGVAFIALAFQFALVVRVVSQIEGVLPSDANIFRHEIHSALFRIGLLSVAFLIPLAALVGLMATFKFAGPIYRFMKYMGEVQSGEAVTEVRLRRGDELMDFCHVVNDTLAPLVLQNKQAKEAAEQQASQTGGQFESQDQAPAIPAVSEPDLEVV